MRAWTARLTRAQSRALALLLLLAVVGGALAVVALPVWQAHARNLERIDTLESQLERFRGHAAAREALERRRQALRTEDGGYYLRADKPTLAAVELQRLVKRSASRAGGEVVSSQVLPAEPVQGFQRVSLRTRMRGDIETLRATLHGLETGKPYLFVDNLRIRVWTVGRRNGPQVGDLDVYFDVYGYMPGTQS